MGAVLGFNERSPFERIQIPRYGDPDWTVAIRPRPTPDLPHRAGVSTMTARALFESPDHAARWANHPSSAPHLVRHYTAWTQGTECAGRVTCTCPPIGEHLMDTLFDIDPPALIYRDPCPPLHKLRCRDCHKTGTITGGGGAPARLDPTGGDGYTYAICKTCSTADGRPGQLARTFGVHGRDIQVADQ